MATPWHDVLAEVATRVNAIEGPQAATAESNYLTRPLTPAQVSSARFHFSMLKDACLEAEAAIVQAIADVANHPWRTILAATTAGLVSGADIPASVGGVPIVGAYGTIKDATNGTPLSQEDLDVIIRRNRRAGTGPFTSLHIYHYKISDRKIYHTRATATIDCCKYDRAASKSLLAGNNNILLPDTVVPAIVAGAVAVLVKDEAYTAQAQYYGNLFAQALAEIATGATSISNNFAPSPQTGSETV